MSHLFARAAAWAVERPVPVIAATVLVTLVGVVAALRLEPDVSADSLVDTGSETFAATERVHERFGDDAVVVLIREDLRKLLGGPDLATLLALESCLSGNAPRGEVFAGRPAPEACAGISELRPSRVVFGPGTFLNQFAAQARRILGAQSQLAMRQALAAARRAALAARRRGADAAEQQRVAAAAIQGVVGQAGAQILALGGRYGLTSLPSIDDPSYVASVVRDPDRAGYTPKSSLAFLLPSRSSALVSARLRPSLTDSERRQAVDLFRQAVEDPAFELSDGDYVVSGAPAVLQGLGRELSTQVFVLLAVALAVMMITLALVFGPPLRLLPLAIAAAASAIAFGLLAAVGGSLTMATIAVLPVSIGLAVDYAIQFQARFGEAIRSGSSAPRAAVEAAASGGPVIGAAAMATVAGFCVLLLSPIPMVRTFGILLVVGVIVSFGLALTAGLATLSLVRSGPRSSGSSDAPEARFLAARLARVRLSIGGGLGRMGRRALATSIAAPGVVLAVALVLAVAGWVLGARADVVSDVRELVPRDLAELRDLHELERATGVSGEVDVAVTAPDSSDPKVIDWMSDFERRVLRRHGFAREAVSCRDEGAEVCPSISLPDLFAAGGRTPRAGEVRRTLALLPPYFRQAVVAEGRSGAPDTALIALGIQVMPLDRQKALIDDIRAQVDPPGGRNDPPPGVEARVVGLPVLAADANDALSTNRVVLTLAGLAAVALALLAIYRSPARALVPLIPVALATGWSALLVAAVGVPLNPLSATLGALVIAIATEFSVILAARFHSERATGGSVGEALRRAYARTGAAVAASGVTAIVGFAVLVVSDMRMLRDFGIVTVLDLSVALIGVLLVLPAALVWAEGGFAPLAAIAGRGRAGEDPEGTGAAAH